jgi:NADP-dependent 3-hydroxy acid dehydrogenase YdfG
MLLENKVAVIYGAGGPIGGAVARAFAREGARVFLAGRTKAKLDKVAGEIRSNGGVAFQVHGLPPSVRQSAHCTRTSVRPRSRTFVSTPWSAA